MQRKLQQRSGLPDPDAARASIFTSKPPRFHDNNCTPSKLTHITTLYSYEDSEILIFLYQYQVENVRIWEACSGYSCNKELLRHKNIEIIIPGISLAQECIPAPCWRIFLLFLPCHFYRLSLNKQTMFVFRQIEYKLFLFQSLFFAINNLFFNLFFNCRFVCTFFFLIIDFIFHFFLIINLFLYLDYKIVFFGILYFSILYQMIYHITKCNIKYTQKIFIYLVNLKFI